MKPFFITTAIHYVTDRPHLGHAYEMFAADILARYYRAQNKEVFFLTGTDEHGLKVAEAAKKNNIEPKVYADEIAKVYQETWKLLNISYDNFIRTTDPSHEKYVQEFLVKLNDAGEIYLDNYEGLYCVACEEYKNPSELIDGNLCPIHKTPCEKISEKVYFFRLSKYQKEIIEFIESDQLKVRPETKKNEILQFLKLEPLKDLAISRSKVMWGIPVPWDNKQTIYVWVDALLNYFTGSKGNWPPKLQLIGKDIFRFHAVIWPAMLLAAKLELPKEIFIHGFLTIDGEKISKTRGNIIDPVEIAKNYSADVLRYSLFREIPFGQDGDFSIRRLEERYQHDLANDLGNLVQRTLVMANKYEIKWEYQEVTTDDENINRAIENLEFNRALDLIWARISKSNQKIDQEKPWELAAKNRQELEKVIGDLLNEIVFTAKLLSPFMPEVSKKISEQLKSKNPEVLFPKK